jgi:hypothetical protein
MAVQKKSTGVREARNIDFQQLIPLHQLSACGIKIPVGVKALHTKAARGLSKLPWIGAAKIEESHVGVFIPGVIGVFLVKFDTPVAAGRKHYVWVVVGDLPTCAFTTEETSTAAEALEWYSVLMSDWSAAVIEKSSLDDVYPVDAATTPKNARSVAARVRFLRRHVIPAFG